MRANGQRIEARVFLADGQAGFGEVDIEYAFRTGCCSRNADPAGIGKEVEHRFSGRFGHHPPSASAQVEEQPWVLPAMPPLDGVAHPHFVGDVRLQGGGQRLFGQGVGDARMALAAVVVDRDQCRKVRQVEGLDRCQRRLVQRLVKALYQQELVVAVDGQARCSFRRAVVKAVGIGLLAMQAFQQ